VTMKAQEEVPDSFAQAILEEAYINGMAFDNEEYEKENFEDLHLYECSLQNCVFDACSFENVRLDDCILNGCTFVNCDLSGVDFGGSIFSFVLLQNCMCLGTDFDRADLAGLRLKDCDISGAVGLKRPPEQRPKGLDNNLVSPLIGLAVMSLFAAAKKGIKEAAASVIKNRAIVPAVYTNTNSSKAVLILSTKIKKRLPS